MDKMYHKSMRNVVSVNELREGTWRKMRLEKAVSEGERRTSQNRVARSETGQLTLAACESANQAWQ